MAQPGRPKDQDKYTAYNYCLLFLDILGQRNAFRDQAWLPQQETEADRTGFIERLRETIRPVMALQRRVDTMLSGILNPDPDLPFRRGLPPDQQQVWDEMQETRVVKQHWSDGIAAYVNLGDSQVKCSMNGVFGLFGLAGAECFQGLALKRPVRGAIDGSWGFEISPGELYGPVVAHAYELESEVAQYPRIVVGERVRQLLEAHLKNDEKSVFAELNKSLAELCLKMIIRDVDGVLIVHYLGDAFRESFTQHQHEGLHRDALAFVTEELTRFRTGQNTKLAFRYGNLMHYFATFGSKTGKAERGAAP